MVVGFHFYSNLMNILQVNSGDPDHMPHYAASDLGLHCLLISQKKDVRLIWGNLFSRHQTGLIATKPVFGFR